MSELTIVEEIFLGISIWTSWLLFYYAGKNNLFDSLFDVFQKWAQALIKSEEDE